MTRSVAIVALGAAFWLDLGTSASPQQPPLPRGQVRVGAPEGGAAYRTQVESEAGGVLRLTNGAVLEVTSGASGALKRRVDAVLLVSGANCRVWIEGQRTRRCSVLTAPSTTPVDFVLTSVAQVSSGGETLTTRDGAVYEVRSLQTNHTSNWRPAAEVAIVDDSRVVNLDQADEIITVVRLR